MNDLSDFGQLDVVPLVVKNPRNPDEPLKGSDEQPWTLQIAGPGHERQILLRNRAIRASLKRQRTGAKEDEERTPEEVQAEGTETLVQHTLGWSPIKLDGQEFAYSPENARKLYDDSRFTWLRTQVNRFISTDSSFLPPPSGS